MLLLRTVHRFVTGLSHTIAPAAIGHGGARSGQIALDEARTNGVLINVFRRADNCRIGEVPIVFIERQEGYSVSWTVLAESLLTPWRLVVHPPIAPDPGLRSPRHRGQRQRRTRSFPGTASLHGTDCQGLAARGSRS
jgi:hypothetical protein